MTFLKNCVFTGFEVEGPDRKKPTLFIADNYISEEDLHSAILKAGDQGIRRIYFGAGGTLNFPAFLSISGINHVLSLVPEDWEIVYETDDIYTIPELLTTKIKVILNIGNPQIDNILIKTENTDVVSVFDLSKITPCVSSLSDIIYEDDSVLHYLKNKADRDEAKKEEEGSS